MFESRTSLQEPDRSSSFSTINDRQRIVNRKQQAGERSRTELSNWNVYLYDEITNAIHHMVWLTEEDELYLDRQVAVQALNVLAILRYQMEINPPKILNHDGEVLAFTWIIGNAKRYLTVSDEDQVNLLHLPSSLNNQGRKISSENNRFPYAEIPERLHVKLKSHSIESQY